MKEEVSASVLLTIAVTLISMGINFFNKNQILPGIVCVIVGLGLIFATILLVKYGVIKEVEKIIIGPERNVG